MKRTSILSRLLMLAAFAIVDVSLTGCDRNQGTEADSAKQSNASTISTSDVPRPPPSSDVASGEQSTLIPSVEEGSTIIFSQPDFEIVVVQDKNERLQLIHRNQLSMGTEKQPQEDR